MFQRDHLYLLLALCMALAAFAGSCSNSGDSQSRPDLELEEVTDEIQLDTTYKMHFP